MHTPHRQSGFTIVETLVAITILMIAIAGPLSVASKGLTTALAARDQLIATYLAQESMEVIKNTRDNNLYNSQPFLAGFPNLCPTNNLCDASAIDGSGGSSEIVGNLGSTPVVLRLNAGGYYSHGGSGTNTIFTRRFYLTQISATEYTATVQVNWHEGTVPYQVRLQSLLIDNIR